MVFLSGESSEIMEGVAAVESQIYYIYYLYFDPVYI